MSALLQVAGRVPARLWGWGGRRNGSTATAEVWLALRRPAKHVQPARTMARAETSVAAVQAAFDPKAEAESVQVVLHDQTTSGCQCLMCYKSLCWSDVHVRHVMGTV
jgi:hypothetical protein